MVKAGTSELCVLHLPKKLEVQDLCGRWASLLCIREPIHPSGPLRHCLAYQMVFDWCFVYVVCLSSLKRMGQEFGAVLLSLLLCLELSGEYLACSNCLSS